MIRVPQFLKDNWIAGIIAAVLGLVSGASSVQLIDTRPDPFTGSEGRDMEMRLKGDIHRLEERVLSNVIEMEGRIKAQQRLWTIEYIDNHVPPKEVQIRLDTLSQQLSELRKAVAETQKLIQRNSMQHK
jgi:hypothetical protein